MTDWKVRYNYGWDWTSRVVQIGVWDDVVLEAVPAASLTDVSCRTDVDGLPTMPASADNPLWRRTSWWIEWDAFLTDTGGDAGDASLEEFVSWSQTRQAAALELAATVVKARFPRAGGFIVWMGHDSFPCTANTAVLDFHGRRKPAAEALERVFKSSPESLRKGGAS